jgi:hypothetical protein
MTGGVGYGWPRRFPEKPVSPTKPFPPFPMKFLFSLALVAALASTALGQVNQPVKRQAINVLRVASAVTDGETVNIGSVVFEVDTTTAAGITTGNSRLNLSGGSTAAAVGTLTSDNTNVSDADTVTVGGKVYTFKTSLTPTEGQVLIGADADGSLLNLIRAINHSGTAGTDYSAAAANANVSAATSVTSHAFAVTARIPGAGGNAITSTETSAHLSWGGGTLASGVSPTAGEFTTALNTAINATNVLGFRVAAVRISANEVLITSAQPGADATACSETLAGSNNAWAAATMFGGSSTAESARHFAVLTRAATATEAALTTMHFACPFAPTTATVQVRTSAGALVAFDGSVTITGNRIDVVSGGSVPVASTNIATVTAGD